MDLGLKNKVVLVAAASRGLGYGIAHELASEGAIVSIGSRTDDDIRKAADRIHTETGAQTMGCVLDASKKDSIENWIDKTTARFGGTDCLVVNAGGPTVGQFDDFNDDNWQTAFELTLMSAVRMIRGVLPSMRKRGGGSILTVTSSSVKEPIDVLLLSNVMRSGVTSLVKSLSKYLATENIRVNNIIPGRIDTVRVRELDKFTAAKRGVDAADIKNKSENEIPLQRYGSIEEFGKAAAFLLSDAASYVTGTTVTVDGGKMNTVW